MYNIGAPVSVWKASIVAFDQCYHDFSIVRLLKNAGNFKCVEQNIILSCGAFFEGRVCWFSLLKLYFQIFYGEMTLIIGMAHLSTSTVVNLEQNINISLNGNLLEIWNEKI